MERSTGSHVTPEESVEHSSSHFENQAAKYSNEGTSPEGPRYHIEQQEDLYHRPSSGSMNINPQGGSLAVAPITTQYEIIDTRNTPLHEVENGPYSSSPNGHLLVQSSSQRHKVHYSDVVMPRCTSNVNLDEKVDLRLDGSFDNLAANSQLYHHYEDRHGSIGSCNNNVSSSIEESVENYRAIDSDATHHSPNNRIVASSLHRVPLNPEKFVVEALKSSCINFGWPRHIRHTVY